MLGKTPSNAGSNSWAAWLRNRASRPALAPAVLCAAAIVLSPAAASAAAGSEQWLPIGPPVAGASLSQVAVGPPAAGTDSIYLVQFGAFGGNGASSGLWHSTDGGATWHGPTLVPVLFPDVQLDAQPGVLYAAGNPDIFEYIGNAMVSRDGGASWHTFPLPRSPLAGIELALEADPLQPGKLVQLVCVAMAVIDEHYLCGTFSLFLTNTGGRGWTFLGSSVPGDFLSPGGLVRLDPADPRQAFAVINGVLFKTAPGSQSLTFLPLRGPVDDLVVAPSAAGVPPTLYAAISRNRAIWKSTDGGKHWAPASAGLPRSAKPVALALDPNHPATLYLATSQAIYASDDGANTWQALPTTGLPAVPVASIAAGLSGPGRTLYAATAGAGAFVLTRP